jgi:hypothetical protein
MAGNNGDSNQGSPVFAGLRGTGWFFLLFAIWLVIQTLHGGSSAYPTFQGYAFVFMLSLFFGLPVAGFFIIILMFADALSRREIKYPWNIVAFIAFTVAIDILAVFLPHLIKEVPLPQSSERWHYFLMQFISFFIVSGIMVIRNVLASFPSREGHS